VNYCCLSFFISPFYVRQLLLLLFFLLKELELLPAKELQENIYVKCPIALEQYLMEGNYNKVCFLIDRYLVYAMKQ